jgi:hypothetical protein
MCFRCRLDSKDGEATLGEKTGDCVVHFSTETYCEAHGFPVAVTAIICVRNLWAALPPLRLIRTARTLRHPPD